MCTAAILTDCIPYMQGIKNNQFSLAIVDPVYGIDGNSHRRNKSRGKATRAKDYPPQLWAQEKTGPEYFAELRRISERQLIFGGNYFPAVAGREFTTPRRKDYDEFIKQNPTNWIIWDKVNGDVKFNDCELIYYSEPIQSEIFYFMWNGMMQGVSFKDGRVMNPNKEANQNRIHPTEKPFEIYKYLFSRFYSPGDTIIDTHLGSGSARIVAYDLGIKFTGTEKEKIYFDAQEKRFKAHAAQLKLF